MSNILLTQVVTKVERVTYTLNQAVELLVNAGAEKESLATMSDSDIAHLLVSTANDTHADAGYGLYERLVDDAQGSGETVDVGEWEVTEVYK